jgi:hypothetical protein
VMRSGHDSSAVSKASASLFDDLCMRGFWKATLSKSIGSEADSRACEIRASTVQSSPPENRIASRARVGALFSLGESGWNGGSGMLSMRDASESRSSCSNCSTEEESLVSCALLGTSCSLRDRDGIAYLAMSFFSLTDLAGNLQRECRSSDRQL